jgi:hypothetical protein
MEVQLQSISLIGSLIAVVKPVQELREPVRAYVLSITATPSLTPGTTVLRKSARRELHALALRTLELEPLSR